MPAAISSINPVDYNPYSPSCTINPCLEWVAGYVDNNPLVQYAACTSLFGSPTVETATPSVHVILSTTTTTVPYIDIVVTVTTTTSTSPETVVSYTTVNEVSTAFTTTLVSTVTQTTAAPTYALVKKDAEKRMTKKRKRGPCRPPSSITSMSTSVHNGAPWSSKAATPSPPSSVSACPNPEEYSSACACINAVSSTKTVTKTASVSTSVVYETVSSAILSLSESVVTVALTTIVYQPVTVTRTSTLATAATAVTTTTTTTTPIAPTQTASIVFANGPRTGSPLIVVGSYLQWTSSGAGNKFAVAVGGGQPWLPNNPTVKMFLHSSSSTVGVLYFETDAQAAASGDPAVSCSVNSADGYLSCLSSTGQHSAVYQCGAYVYLAIPNLSQTGCTKLNLKLSPWLS
ncbi:hypothetical protein V8F20_011180 [Naviculisporaceae sp. PSN 640]